MVISSLLAGAAGGATVSVVINAVDSFSKTFAMANKSLAAIGVGITAIGVVGAVGIAAVTKTAIEFESAFAGVRKTVELSEAEFAKLNQRFKDISTSTPVTFVELSKIGELAGQLGVNGVDNLEKFTKTIADISVTTNLTSEQAATDFARIANIMQIPLDQVDRMGATIVDLGNNFATTEAEISLFAQRVAGAGKIAGLTTADIMAIGTAMSSVGVRAEAGGTAVQKMLIKMNTSVQQGGDELEVFAQTAGYSAEEFQRVWQEDASTAFGSFVTGLGSQGDAAISTLEELGMSDVRLVRSFLSLANAGNLVTDTFDTANKAWEENNALTEEANKRYETAQSQMIIFKNKITAVSDTMGRVMIPVLIKVLDKVGAFLDYLEEHPKLTKFAIVAIAVGSALALILGPLLILVALLPALSAGFAMLSLASLPITGTILAIAAAIAILVADIILLKKWWDKIRGKSNTTARVKVVESPNTSDMISSSSNAKENPTIYINNVNGLTGKDIADSIKAEYKNVIRI